MFDCLSKYSEDEMAERIASVSCEISPDSPLNISDIIVQVRLIMTLISNTFV